MVERREVEERATAVVEQRGAARGAEKGRPAWLNAGRAAKRVISVDNILRKP